MNLKAHIVVYGFAPYILLTITNLMLIHSIKAKEKNAIHSNEKPNTRKKSLTYTVMILTTLFILFTLADNILNAFYLPIILPQDYGYALLFFADSLAFSYHSLHFSILLISNKKFKSEFKLMLKRSNKVENIRSDKITTVES